jgi:hypothetical protein
LHITASTLHRVHHYRIAILCIRFSVKACCSMRRRSSASFVVMPIPHCQRCSAYLTGRGMLVQTGPSCRDGGGGVPAVGRRSPALTAAPATWPSECRASAQHAAVGLATPRRLQSCQKRRRRCPRQRQHMPCQHRGCAAVAVGQVCHHAFRSRRVHAPPTSVIFKLAGARVRAPCVAESRGAAPSSPQHQLLSTAQPACAYIGTALPPPLSFPATQSPSLSISPSRSRVVAYSRSIADTQWAIGPSQPMGQQASH